MVYHDEELLKFQKKKMFDDRFQYLCCCFVEEEMLFDSKNMSLFTQIQRIWQERMNEKYQKREDHFE